MNRIFIFVLFLILPFIKVAAQAHDDVEYWYKQASQAITARDAEALRQCISEIDRCNKLLQKKNDKSSVPDIFKTPVDTARVIELKALYSFLTKDYNSVIALNNQVLEFYRHKNDIANQFGTLDQLSKVYVMSNDYKGKLQVDIERMTMAQQLFGPRSGWTGIILLDIADDNTSLKNHREALQRTLLAVSILNTPQGRLVNDSAWVNVQSQLFTCYANLGDLNGMKTSGSELLSEVKKVYGTSGMQYVRYLVLYEMQMARYGYYSEDVINDIKRSIENSRGVDEDMYEYSKKSLMYLYASMGKNEQALTLGRQFADEMKTKHGDNSQEYASVLQGLALVYNNISDFETSCRLTEEVLQIERNLGNTNQIMKSLSILGNNYSNMQQYEKSIQYLLEVKKEYETAGMMQTGDYASILQDLSLPYIMLKQYDTGFSYARAAVDLYKKLVSTTSLTYLSALNNLAWCNKCAGKTDEAIKIYNELLNVNDHNFDKKSWRYAHVLQEIGSSYADKGDWKVALNNNREALQLLQDIYGFGNLETLQALSIVASQELSCNLYNQSVEDGTRFAEGLKNAFASLFDVMSSATREQFWNYNKNFLMDDYPIIVSQALSDKAIANLYDYSALFAKGLLLNADTEVSKIIEHSGDKKLISEYESIKEMKGVLLKIQENPTEQAKLIADSLSTLINKREVDLIGRSKAYGDFTRNLNITWRDVQKGLGNDDVAVEFLSFLSGDERNYVALTLTKDDACPQFTQLSFRDKDLKALNANELFNSDKIYEMVWKPLLSRIGGKKRIYFSPSGALYNIAIEFAPHMENYQLYRLSSTRVLAQKNSKKVTVNPKVVLYGNLMYDAEPKELVDANNRNGYDFNRGFNVVKNSLNAELLHVRSGFGILNNTGFEVNNIADELSAHKISCVKLTGVNGTEESFKSLSGKKFAVIHLATHGMYISDLHVNQMRNDHNMQFLHLDNYRSKVFSQPKEDVSMTHSFLVMSGGNMLINGDKIPEGMDDGILTAQEIAGVDLRGCDLVVMSACDTGLGDISSEGVMGLQRGFKKAGAKTIIMSLNEVPDKPTMEFMTLFYDALTAGKSKYEAFTHARLTMKAKYPAPDQYQYWASFILLDGIDGIE